MNLRTPLSTVLHTTKDHLASLEGLGISTVGDLLLYLPRAYEDLSNMQTLATAPLDTKVTLRGNVDSLKLVYTRQKKKIVQAKFTDSEGGTADVLWFNQPHILRMLKEGQEVVFTGKVVEKGYKLQIISPQFETATAEPLVHAGKLVPIYPQHDIVSTKWLREKMVLLRSAVGDIPETLPKEVLEEERLMGRADAIRALHFPENGEEVVKAQQRMAFEELYHLQVESLERKKLWQGNRQERLKIPMDALLIRALFASLKFAPTKSQKIAIYEILQDMEKDRAMSRLLEGDVGSGKTLVATAVIAHAIRHGGQCALMVPTEVLAKQHVQSIGKTLVQFHSFIAKQKQEGGEFAQVHMPLASIGLLTGSMTAGESMQVKQGTARGTVDVVIGTHALIEESVQFKNLTLVIVDEQHRFGVLQRERLTEKGNPHFLAMTATPIPRTLALTAYGHHDLSVLLEKPGNRQPIHTKVVPPSERKTIDLFIDQQIRDGRQVFVVCPLIMESESDEMQEIRNVHAEEKRLREEFPHRRIAMLHGRMHPKEKDETMRKFKEKEFDILVSTAVIEVGIDVPNATVIIIEGAERFGLSQLHQFRGRVGRGDHASYCFLFTTTPAQARSERLRAMEKYSSGFELAEIDLQLRGPGELFGLRQSGIPEVRVGLLLHPELTVRARRAAERTLAGTPAER